MNLKIILEKVIDIMAEHDVAKKTEINGASRLDSFDIDSMDLIELELAFEKEFKVAVNLSEGTIPETVEDIIMHIAKKLA